MDTLLKESWEVFLNGLTHLETAQDIIVKVEEAKQAAEKVKNNVENVISRV